MCIAIAVKAGQTLSYETLSNSYDANPDGCGVAYIDDDGVIQIYKTLDFLDFYKEYKEIEDSYPNSDKLVHFRIKTHGRVDLANCHPFQINEDMVMMHNGTISNVPNHKDKSDTRMFVEHYLQHLKDGWIECDAVRDSIEEMIGWSKICVLHRTKGIFIYNEEKGHWVDECGARTTVKGEGRIWYSNDSYKYAPVYKKPATTTPAMYNQPTKSKAAAGTESACDWEVDRPTKRSEECITPSANLPSVITPEVLDALEATDNEVARYGATVYRKCVGCDTWHDESVLFEDPDSDQIIDHYCIACVEYIYAPYEILEYTDEQGTQDLTFYEYLIESGMYHDQDIVDYVERFEQLMVDLEAAGVEDPHSNYKREMCA